jgi:hypothetical protein
MKALGVIDDYKLPYELFDLIKADILFVLQLVIFEDSEPELNLSIVFVGLIPGK